MMMRRLPSERILELLRGRLDILRVSVELREEVVVVLALKQSDPFVQRGAKQKKVAAFVSVVGPSPGPGMFFIVRHDPNRVSHRANELTESSNPYHSRAPVVFRSETPRTHRVAPPCRRPRYLHWSIWIRDCRPGNRRRRQRHCALRKWPSGIYYHLQGCRLQTIQRRSTRRRCYASS